jgi:hypothetical protein
MKKMTILISLLAILAGYLWAQPLLAQAPIPRPTPDREAMDAGGPWIHRPQTEPSSYALTLAPASAIASWSKIAYQEYIGNWDVFSMGGDGSQPTRLTSSGGADITPRLNRGATRLVYASTEPGNYEIYVMNINGSSRARLTKNPANDYNPAWSPDGSKIVFNSYRDGQSEVYVMNADGSGQTRLTFSPDYDGEPVWSPDGSKIAFVSIRDVGQQIYTMKPDGSNVTRITAMNATEFPCWSPDSSQLAFSADPDGDSWLELMAINADGTNVRSLADTGTTADLWARSWSPDGRFIASTLIGFINYQGNWYWTNAYLTGLDLTNNQLVRLGASDVAWHPDWQSTDSQPPFSSMAALPTISPSPINVHWSGGDAGVSGLFGYDVQVKDINSGTWTTWLTRTTATSAGYPGIGGHTYAFRVRAWDQSGNVEAWRANPDASTTVEALPPTSAVSSLPAYWRGDLAVTWGGSDPGGSGIQTYDVQYQDGGSGAWVDWQIGISANSAILNGTIGHTYAFRVRAHDRAQNLGEWSLTANAPSTTYYLRAIKGSVYDIRLRPVFAALISALPAALNTAQSQVHGNYEVYSADSNTRSITVTKDGYGAAPSMTLDLATDALPFHILPPTDNLIQDGDFESEIITASWQVSGIPTPVLSSATTHTGRQAVQLGTPFGISTPQNLYQSPWNAFSPSLTVDNNRTVHLIVTLADVTGNVFYYASKSVTGTWPISPTALFTDGAAGVFIAPDNEGGVHIVWNSQNQYASSAILYCHKLADIDSCSVPENLTNGSMGAMASQLIRDADGGLHLIGNSGASQIIYAYRSPQGTWGPIQNTGLLGLLPNGTVDLSGNVHIVWDTFTENAYYAMYSVKTPNGTWSGPIILGQSNSWPDPVIVAEDEGTLHVLYRGIQKLNYLAKDPKGAWSLPASINQPQEIYLGNFHLGIDSAGTLHALFGTGTQYPAANQIYALKPHGQDWTRHAQAIYSSTDILRSAFAVDNLGVMHAMWSSWLNQPTYLTYAQTTVAPVEDNLEVKQAITLPTDLHRPTLSWLFSPTTPMVGDNKISIRLNNGLTETEVFSSTPTGTSWAPYWTDMSAWTGKAVTLSLRLHQAAGSPFAQGYLDEISLGSWLTPNPQAVMPKQLEATTSNVITITGDNFIAPTQVRLNDTPLPDAHWVNTNTITATVPVLPIGRYDVIVTNPGGQASGLPSALLVGHEVLLPLIRK